MRRFLFPLLLLVALLLVIAAPAFAAPLSPPWDGNPVSPLLLPTSFGLTDWAGGSYATEAAASRQTPPLAIIPNSAIGPTLGLIQTEAAGLGVPHRMDYMVSGKSAGGRDMYVVVVNALETANQRRDYARWQNIREIELTDPVQAQALLDSYGADVKMPIYIEANINGSEYEGTDAMMQAIRDLTTTPRGENATIDKIVDHCILVVVPTANPDGRVAGRRGNDAVADTNRDNFLQSQPEEKIDTAIMQQYLAPAGLDMHGYVTPTLIDGLTMPHNPGFQYDIFAKWNQARTAQNKVDFNAMGYQIQRPVNDWNANGSLPATGHLSEVAIGGTTGDVSEVGTTVTVLTAAAHNLAVGNSITIAGVSVAGYNGTFTVASVIDATHFTYTNSTSGLAASRRGAVWSPTYPDVLGPQVSQTWDDWGPFYGQTYMAFLGVDSSTVEMASTTRLVSKTAQYMAFYSSANFWLDRRQDMIHDQLEIFRRGVTNTPTDPNAISKVPMLVDLGFTDALHNWMPTYPKAYVIPWGQGQRSDAAANRLAQWCLDNGIQVQRMASDFTRGSQTFQAGSYVVSMSQALRGLAWNALSAGTDIETRITDLYASPAAWSHGLLWGADTLEIPRDDATFAPSTNLIFDTNSLVGGVRGGVDAPAGFYSVTLKGVNEDKAVLALLRSGVSGLIAEAPFTSTTGGATPAGSLIFPADGTTAAALDAAGKAGGMWFERNVGVTMPATTVVANAPRIAILVSSVPTTGADTDGCLTRIFGADAKYVATVTGSGSLQSSTTNPLANFDVIYNAGAAWPTSANATALARLSAFFARGGGYIATSTSTNGFSFLTSAVPALVPGSLTQTSQNAFGGIAVWTNVGGANSPLTGSYPSSDYMFLPSNTTFFSATPTGAIVDAQYPEHISTIGPQYGYVAGMWLNRTTAADNAPVLIHGTTTADSRYVAYATNPFSRYDAEREWPLIVQAALWSDLTDEGQVAFTITATAGAGGAISPSGANMVAVGADKTYAITAASGYGVADVTVDGQSVGAVTSYTFDNVAIGHTIAASFTINTYTITPSAGANGTISPNTVQTVNYGATPTFTITPATGYHVADVLVGGTSVGAVTSYQFPSVAANHTISATFAADVVPPPSTFTITKTVGANGSIDGNLSVDSGSDAVFTITPATGYHVGDVTVDGVSKGAISSYTFTNVTANHAISATFAADAVPPPSTFTITKTVGANGSIDGNSSVDSGSDAVFTITPATGYHVADVTVDGVSKGAISSYTFTNVTANHAISATFAVTVTREKWKVTLKLSKSSVKVNTKVKYSGTVRTSTGRAGSGVVTIQKRRASGGSWVNWRTDRLNASGNYSITVKMTNRQTWSFRARMPGDAVNRTGFSAPKKLRVY